MNIGIVTTWFERGAAYVSRQYMEVLQQNHNVFIYARGGEKFAKNDKNWNLSNVTWDTFNIYLGATSLNLTNFKKWIKDNNIELVLFNEQHWWLPVIECKKMGIKTASYIDYYTVITIPFFEIYDALICNTKRHYSVFEWHKNANYIPWGTNTELFQYKEQPHNDNKIKFFHSCGYDPYRKGTDQLIKAFAKLNGDKQLIIHSQKKLEIDFPELKPVITDLIDKNELIIQAETIGIPGLYYMGDVYVYPARLDGVGLTMAEAISSGLPIIVPDNQPMSEFASDKSCSKKVSLHRLYAEDDRYYWPRCLVKIDDLAAAMQFFIDNNNNINEYKKLARKYAENNLNWYKNAEKLPNIVENIQYSYNQNIIDKILNYEKKEKTLPYQSWLKIFKKIDVELRHRRRMKKFTR